MDTSTTPDLSPPEMDPDEPVYARQGGAAFCGDSRVLLAKLPDNGVDAVITSLLFGLADP